MIPDPCFYPDFSKSIAFVVKLAAHTLVLMQTAILNPDCLAQGLKRERQAAAQGGDGDAAPSIDAGDDEGGVDMTDI